MSNGESEKIPNQNEQLRANEKEARLGLNPVFFEAAKVQNEFAQEIITKEEAHEFWRGNQDIARLNTIVEQEELMGQKMTLSGLEVIVPKVTTNVLNDSTVIKASKKELTSNDPLELSYAETSIEGPFKGFGLRFKAIYEDDAYIPVLTYKIFTGRLSSPYAVVDKIATGDVGVSNAIFEKDQFNDVLDGLLQNLHSLAPDNEEEIASLSRALAKEPLKTEFVTYVAWKSNVILDDIESDKKQLVEDVISDLIMHYLKKTPSFRMKTPAYLVPQSSQKPDLKTYIATYSSPRVFEQNIRDVTFMERYELTDHGPRQIGQRALYIVLAGGNDESITYVPVHELSEFQKV